MGIDEAGRGCVIGPMVLGAVSLPRDRERELVELGIGDSKSLSSSRREELYLELAGLSFVKIESRRVSPALIDSHSLGDLTRRFITSLALSFGSGEVFLDVPAPSSRVSQFLEKIRHRCREAKELQISGDNKGEDKFPVVAAASIVAKVERDRIIEEIKEETEDFGSGYPSDPRTRDYLQRLLQSSSPLPDHIRKKWKTLDKLRQRTLFDE